MPVHRWHSLPCDSLLPRRQAHWKRLHRDVPFSQTRKDAGWRLPDGVETIRQADAHPRIQSPSPLAPVTHHCGLDIENETLPALSSLARAKFRAGANLRALFGPSGIPFLPCSTSISCPQRRSTSFTARTATWSLPSTFPPSRRGTCPAPLPPDHPRHAHSRPVRFEPGDIGLALAHTANTALMRRLGAETRAQFHPLQQQGRACRHCTNHHCLARDGHDGPGRSRTARCCLCRASHRCRRNQGLSASPPPLPTCLC